MAPIKRTMQPVMGKTSDDDITDNLKDPTCYCSAFIALLSTEEVFEFAFQIENLKSFQLSVDAKILSTNQL